MQITPLPELEEVYPFPVLIYSDAGPSDELDDDDGDDDDDFEDDRGYFDMSTKELLDLYDAMYENDMVAPIDLTAALISRGILKAY